MEEKLVSWTCCHEGKYVWCYDGKIGTVSKINMDTLQIEKIVSPMKILNGDRYEIGKILRWKDKIVFIPVEINRRWIIYNEQNDMAEQVCIGTECYSSAEAVLSEDVLFLFPLFPENPILIIDLLKRKIIRKIGLADPNFKITNDMKIWNAKKVNGSIIFFIYNSSFFGIVNSNGCHFVRVCADEPIASADFGEDGGWAVSECGKYLYRFDINGSLLDKKTINNGTRWTRFARIIVGERKIILLPAEESQIRVFDMDIGRTMTMGNAYEKESCKSLELVNKPAYWECMIKEDCVWILPIRYPLRIIGLKNLTFVSKILKYNGKITENDYQNYCNYMRSNRTFCFYEGTPLLTIGEYIKLVRGNELMFEKKGLCFGKKIWKQFR